MVRIRYSELPVGLHVTAVAVGRQTIVYLLPGLTAAERKSALLRVRSSARVGHGPSLPAFALAKALAADRLRGAMLTLAAAMRRHPVLLVPLMALVLSVALLVIVSGTAGATPGRISAPKPPPVAASPPCGWHRFARHPEPLAWKHYRLRIARGQQHRGSRARNHSGPAWLRTDGRSARRGLVASARRVRRHGQRSSRTPQIARHWRPPPCHVGVSTARITLSLPRT